MVAYSFKGRFAPRIEDRSKKQTIRAVGKKRHTRPGERMTMTTGDRFHPKAIGAATCQSVDPIEIYFESTTPGGKRKAPHIVIRSGEPEVEVIRQDGLDNFARLDGFDDWDDMVAFWKATHPAADSFKGLRIFWGDTFSPA